MHPKYKQPNSSEGSFASRRGATGSADFGARRRSNSANKPKEGKTARHHWHCEQTFLKNRFDHDVIASLLVTHCSQMLQDVCCNLRMQAYRDALYYSLLYCSARFYMTSDTVEPLQALYCTQKMHNCSMFCHFCGE